MILENYFNYFTEIEEHFQKRRGRIHLSPLDWALIENWKDAGIPLEAVLRGVDAAFDKYESRPSKSQKVNSLAYCAQAVLVAAEEMKEAAVGTTHGGTKTDPPSGFQVAEISAFLRQNAEKLDTAKLPQAGSVRAEPLVRETAGTLREIAAELDFKKTLPRLEDLERRLTVAEEKLYAVLLAATPDEQIINVRAEADRELAPYRRKMPSSQIEQLQKQYIHKRLLEKYGLPRLSLFYM